MSYLVFIWFILLYLILTGFYPGSETEIKYISKYEIRVLTGSYRVLISHLALVIVKVKFRKLSGSTWLLSDTLNRKTNINKYEVIFLPGFLYGTLYRPESLTWRLIRYPVLL